MVELVALRQVAPATVRAQSETRMKTLITFVVTWTTVTLLLLWLADFKMYVKFPSGSTMLKEQATPFQGLIYSILAGGFYSLINTGLQCGNQKLGEHSRKRTQP